MNQISKQLSLVIPIYNDVEAASHFLPEVIHWANQQQMTCEILLVDDGSKDDIKTVYEQAQTHLGQSVSLSLLQLSRNFGKEVALSAGLQHANGEIIAMLDADGQHPISVLSEMLDLLHDDIDVVAAVQETRHHESMLSKLLKKGFYLFLQDKQRFEIKANAGDFRVMRRKVVDALLELPERQRFMKGLYSWVGFTTIYYPFSAAKRKEGNSKFNYAQLLGLAITGITSFSHKPLRWIMNIGILISFFSFLYGLYIVFEKLILGNPTAGWATIAAGLMFSTGLQMICLGIIAEYTGRIYEESKQRPLYIIKNRLTSSETTDSILE